MIENIEQAKKHLKKIINFYKLNDENNYDYTDKDLISIRIVLEEIERLIKGCKALEEEIDDLRKLEATLTIENERLDNIINELEKYILATLNTPEFDFIQKDLIEGILYKLRKLKGEDEE